MKHVLLSAFFILLTLLCLWTGLEAVALEKEDDFNWGKGLGIGLGLMGIVSLVLVVLMELSPTINRWLRW